MTAFLRFEVGRTFLYQYRARSNDKRALMARGIYGALHDFKVVKTDNAKIIFVCQGLVAVKRGGHAQRCVAT